MKFDNDSYKITNSKGSGFILLIVGILITIISGFGYFTDSTQFFMSYLVAWIFWVSIGLGALFFVMLNHLTGAVWSMVLRRITESVMIALPFMAIFSIPLIFGLHDMYHWTHTEDVAKDVILSQKTGYLNVPFFLIRSAVYFMAWFFIARKLYKTSIEQDNNPTAEQIKKMRRVSGPGIVVFALTISFAGFDWLMSLDAHWYSTIFGLYFFSGGLLSSLAVLALIGMYLRKNGALTEIITVEHYHDLGKLMFAFTIFWGYMAFSQYFLIWYANIPEETIWYQHRWEGNWKILSLTLVFGHFVLPFMALMTRAAKRNLKWLMIISVWIIAMHWIDLYWITMPTYSHHGFHFSWMDLTLFIGIGGVFLGIFWKYLSSTALIPLNDTSLPESIKFSNN